MTGLLIALVVLQALSLLALVGIAGSLQKLVNLAVGNVLGRRS